MHHLAGVSLVAVLVLAACGGAAPPSAVPSSPAVAPSKPATSSAAAISPAGVSAAPAKPAASGNPAAASSAPLKVGILETLTGGSAQIGKDNQDGFNLYLDAAGGVMAGRKIEPIFVDDQFQPDVGLTKAKELVENQKVALLMGGHNTSVCYALIDYVKQVQVPFAITGNCGAELLTIDPKFKTPYVARFTDVINADDDPMADWAYKQGHRKAILITSDFNPGIEHSDSFASTFIRLGGSIVQEFHPGLGSKDFGPYLAQFSSDADSIAEFLPGSDALRFGDQLATYGGAKKLQLLDMTAQVVDGSNVPQLKDKVLGIVANKNYSEAYDGAVNQAFLKAFHTKYPGRVVSANHVTGYVGAQVLGAALKKVNGDMTNKQAFLEALDATSIETPRGPIKLDADHDIVQNIYIYQYLKQGDSFSPKLLNTYNAVAKTWDRTPEELAKFPFGQVKGKWPGMTKDQLAGLSK